ncbi:MAG: CPBP family intramembrane metalloprotease, partial [Armatimonadia bacterium]|nr:CPBP family intramembrane metalloprotease [Armatimonadia bacterium]
FVPLYLSAFFEEIVLRGYLQRTLFLAWGHAGAVAGSAACFGLLHAWNPGIGWLGVVNILLVGVLLSLIVIRTNEIWTVTGVHFGWNLMLGPVLGLPVSGVHLDSILRLEPTGDASFLAGGEFGPEASPLVSVVLLVAIAIVGALVARRRRWHEPPDEEAERPVEPPQPRPTAYDASSAPDATSSAAPSASPPREPEARPEPPASQ